MCIYKDPNYCLILTARALAIEMAISRSFHLCTGDLLTTDAILLVHPQGRLSYTSCSSRSNLSPWKIFSWRLSQASMA
ncbi:hypothetical protein F2Q69_00043006 [Brassica cretica]|uniref:Uncharacterized protein n=1 Tax=Brassica cretica TaxID=69181 RepID=A0A8S9N3T8_BRACR|nr:hypothetical protein F2Q69_00043006 [Brassica cretica]